jgi:hypothetical protein
VRECIAITDLRPSAKSADKEALQLLFGPESIFSTTPASCERIAPGPLGYCKFANKKCVAIVFDPIPANVALA